MMKNLKIGIILGMSLILLCSCGKARNDKTYEQIAPEMMGSTLIKETVILNKQENAKTEGQDKGYLSENRDKIAIPDDYDTCLRLCQDASNAYISLLKNKEQDIDFSDYIMDARLADYVSLRATSYPHAVCSANGRFFITSYKNLSNDCVCIKGVISLQSGATIENIGENIFVLKNEDGRIIIKDWYHDNPDSLDCIYRLNKYESIEDTRFWECEDVFEPFLELIKAE